MGDGARRAVSTPCASVWRKFCFWKKLKRQRACCISNSHSLQDRSVTLLQHSDADFQQRPATLAARLRAAPLR